MAVKPVLTNTVFFFVALLQSDYCWAQVRGGACHTDFCHFIGTAILFLLVGLYLLFAIGELVERIQKHGIRGIKDSTIYQITIWLSSAFAYLWVVKILFSQDEDLGFLAMVAPMIAFIYLSRKKSNHDNISKK